MSLKINALALITTVDVAALWDTNVAAEMICGVPRGRNERTDNIYTQEGKAGRVDAHEGAAYGDILEAWVCVSRGSSGGQTDPKNV